MAYQSKKCVPGVNKSVDRIPWKTTGQNWRQTLRQKEPLKEAQQITIIGVVTPLLAFAGKICTGDGRNPAPPGMYKTFLKTCDSLHINWCRRLDTYFYMHKFPHLRMHSSLLHALTFPSSLVHALTFRV